MIKIQPITEIIKYKISNDNGRIIYVSIDKLNDSFTITNSHGYREFIFKKYENTRDIIELLRVANDLIYKKLNL